MKIRRVSAVCVLFFCMLSVARAQHVQTDFDHQANFSQYKTFSWQAVKVKSPLWDDRIKNAVTSALVAKGRTQMDSGGDVAIVAIGMTRTQHTLQTFYDGFGGGWRWRGGGEFGTATTTEQDYKEGTLVVDLYDGNSKELIWRGTSQDTLSDKADKNEKKLEKGVEKMFKDFPPGSAKR
jgi:hypothetical protein